MRLNTKPLTNLYGVPESGQEPVWRAQSFRKQRAVVLTVLALGALASSVSGCTNKEGQVDTSQGNPAAGPVTSDTSSSSSKTSPVAEGNKNTSAPSEAPSGAGKDATAVTNETPKEVPGGPGGTMMNKPSKNPMGALGDAEITLRVKNALIADTNVEARYINVDTKSQVTLLRGTQKTQAAIDAAIADAKQVKGVDQVISQLKVGEKN